MTNTKTREKTRSSAPTSAVPATRGRPSWLGWAAFLIPAVALAVAVALSMGTGKGDTMSGLRAPDFALPATDGSTRSLAGYLTEGKALLYFSMGPGCDGCFLQIPEAEQRLTDLGLTLVPIMVDPAPVVAAEARRFGISTPILIDADRAVSSAYDMIDAYGHGDRPSHSFALVDSGGNVETVAHYAEMFVPIESLLADLGLAG